MALVRAMMAIMTMEGMHSASNATSPAKPAPALQLTAPPAKRVSLERSMPRLELATARLYTTTSITKRLSVPDASLTATLAFPARIARLVEQLITG